MRQGLIMGLSAYVLWGLSPIYWKQLSAVDPADIVGNRVVWSLVLLVGIQVARSRGADLMRFVRNHPRSFGLMGVSAVLLSINWLVFVWSVANDRVVEASLGYFINPLVAVFLGVAFLGERLPRAQWLAIGLAGCGVAWLTYDLGSLPWVSLTLACSFGAYGLIRKTAKADSLDGLTFEMIWMAPVGIVYLVWRALEGEPAAVATDPEVLPLLIGGAVMTTAPLLLFAGSARRVPLAVVGLMQYITPTMQFIIGVWLYGEAFDGGQLIGFSFIWLALIVFSADVARNLLVKQDAEPLTISP